MDEENKKVRLWLFVLLVGLVLSNYFCLKSKSYFYNVSELVEPGRNSFNNMIVYALIFIIFSLIEFYIINRLDLKGKLKIVVNIISVYILLASFCYIYDLIYIHNYNQMHWYLEFNILLYKNYDLINITFYINTIGLVLTVLLNVFLIFYKPNFKDKLIHEFYIFEFKNIGFFLAFLVVIGNFVTYNVNQTARTEIDFSKNKEVYVFKTYTYDEGYRITVGVNNKYFETYEEKLAKKEYISKEDCLPYIIKGYALQISGGLYYYGDNEGIIKVISGKEYTVKGRLFLKNKGDAVTFKYLDPRKYSEKYGIVYINNSFTVRVEKTQKR